MRIVDNIEKNNKKTLKEEKKRKERRKKKENKKAWTTPSMKTRGNEWRTTFLL